jgi:hypothetical protein
MAIAVAQIRRLAFRRPGPGHMGIRRKPLSSTRTRWAPRRAAFFYSRPGLARPPGYGRLVPLHGAALGLLTTPAERGQHLPDVAGVVANSELVLDQCGDPPQRPDIGPVACLERALPQALHQRPPLGRGQARRASGRGLGP